MNKKAFTLAELLGVIVILGIIGLVAITIVDNSMKKGRYETCIAQETNLIEATKNLLTDRPGLLPNSGSTSIKVSKLKSDGYIDDKLENPMTNKPYDDNDSVTISTNNGKKFTYEVTYQNPDDKCQK